MELVPASAAAFPSSPSPLLSFSTPTSCRARCTATGPPMDIDLSPVFSLPPRLAATLPQHAELYLSRMHTKSFGGHGLGPRTLLPPSLSPLSSFSVPRSQSPQTMCTPCSRHCPVDNVRGGEYDDDHGRRARIPRSRSSITTGLRLRLHAPSAAAAVGGRSRRDAAYPPRAGLARARGGRRERSPRRRFGSREGEGERFGLGLQR
ncbi:hypothetical protein B0H19DRAFT_385192 [Mycena capillaripes]|nr:hypothetical protein B0H19DRAFT_385192 [Mycena capillaripes]